MKRLTALLLFPAMSFGQAALHNGNTVVRSLVQKPGVVLTDSSFDSDQTDKNLIAPGGAEAINTKLLIQVSSINASLTTTFMSNDRFETYPTNWFAGKNATYTQARGQLNNWLSSGTGTVVGNTHQDGSAQHLTTTLTGSAVTSVNIATASLDGIPNGTYSFFVSSGGGCTSALSGTFTITSATLTTGYTGGQITSTSFSGGTGCTSAPSIIILATFTVSATGASGGFQVGDYIDVVQYNAPSPQVDIAATGWSISTSGGSSIIGETTDLSQT